MHESILIQRALLTVYDKTHIVALAERLHLHGTELISTGNTATLLKSHGLPVMTVEEYTGFPEIMQGRVKTLHPKIHGGILGRRDQDIDIMSEHQIPDIDLVVVNLYPFQKVISKKGTTLEEAIENIDIGGPTLIRGCAKNFAWSTILVDPNDYEDFLNELDQNQGRVHEATRFRLAIKAFTHTAQYESSIARYFNQQSQNLASNEFPQSLFLNYELKQALRYGENPHQKSAFYQEADPGKDSITLTQQHQGKALSYNNINDTDTALECVKQFHPPACIIVKHANPCGGATATSLMEAYEKAFACDPTSAFGGIIAFNSKVDEDLIRHILNKQFVEVLVAPEFSAKALEIIQDKPNCRVLQYQPMEHPELTPRFDIKSVNGGILIQTYDTLEDPSLYEVVTKVAPSEQQMQDLIFSWKIAKFVKSNAIVFAKNGQTLAIGAGQMSRIFSTQIAQLKAHEHHFSLQSAVMASDAFFPFQDNIEKAHEYGIQAIIQPGGALRDEEIIACANRLGIAMVFTKTRHFRH